MSMADRLIEAMRRSATRVYEPGAEVVSQLEHALQCADLAEIAGADIRHSLESDQVNAGARVRFSMATLS